ncbi:MAG: hypothetical protein ACYTF3_11785 [Planctomycetota bacterium]|jgi:hypothetical protein
MSSDPARTPKRVLVIGSGQRVREAALPALASLPEAFELAEIRSRKPKTIESGGHEHEVLPLEGLDQAALDGFDLIYLVVKKPAVPLVLRQLGALNLARVDLLIETPVLLTKHLGHRKLLRPFRNVWVSEDCSRRTRPLWVRVPRRRLAAHAVRRTAPDRRRSQAGRRRTAPAHLSLLPGRRR